MANLCMCSRGPLCTFSKVIRWNQEIFFYLWRRYFPLGSLVAFLGFNLITKFLKIKKGKKRFKIFNFRKEKKNVCRTSQNCTGIILLGLSSKGLYIQLKKVFRCWGTLIYTTIHQWGRGFKKNKSFYPHLMLWIGYSLLFFAIHVFNVLNLFAMYYAFFRGITIF